MSAKDEKKKANKSTTATKSKQKKASKATAPEKEAKELSAKAQVYLLWKKGEETEPEKLAEKCGGGAKTTTIKSWLRGWAKGERLPAIAKDEEMLKKHL